ncbi:uncharacterized protein LOC111594251 isoform X3 [Drosophila hydei]|uniref:Uncharacterized protein LOC111594251 isoform X3 n=1 Tax=Drosophila hydei TaxID=7224 RepID=A0A6J1LFI0_DROHY|nr:uncharacterized protein LOC111594251 isoform X3 [Drosophila hydei]
MSSPDDGLEEGSNNFRLMKRSGASPSGRTSSDDSVPGNDSSNHSADMEKSTEEINGYEPHNSQIEAQNSVEIESDISQQTVQLDTEQSANAESASARKAKKRKAKRNKQRRGSKEVALMGWSGAFPNLSSTHSLESNSDVDQQQLPTDLKAICATGLSVFPREDKEQGPPLSSSSSSDSTSLSPVSQHKTPATTTTAAFTITTNSTTPSPKSTQTTNNNNVNNNDNNSASMSLATRCPRSEPSSEPESETESQADLAKQPKRPKKRSFGAAADVDPVAGMVAGEESNASSSSLLNKSGRKRVLSKRGTPDKQENESKRTKPSNQNLGCSLRTRSKSLHDPNPDVPPRTTRARSVCPATLRNQTSDPIAQVPASSETKTPARRRSGAAVKLPPTDEYYCLPFKYGWKRELVLRSNASMSRQRGDVIFISPGGKKLRSREDIIPLLKGELTIDHFCFQRQMQQAGEQYETVRQAQPAPLRRKSGTGTKQQTTTNSNSHQLQSAVTPVSGKRVPKPKVPKGASPPPEGWTSTMAVKGNARVLAASNCNNSSGGGSGSGNSARKRSNHSKQSAKTAPEQPAVQANVQNPSVVDKMMICVYCLKQINEKQAFPVGTAHVNSYICMQCVKPGTKATNLQQGAKGLPAGQAQGQANGVKKQELIDENVNANTKSATDADGGKTSSSELNVNGNSNSNGNGALLEIGGEIELPGALPPDQLLSDEAPASRAGNKITPKPLEVVVINGRKALAIAGEPPRPRLQVIPREPDLEIYEKHFLKRNSRTKEKRQNFVECVSAGNLSCQVMSAVMKTLDMHDRVRMSHVCKTWAMIARDRGVWRTLKLRDTHITKWLFLLRDMARYRTYELDMMGVKMENPKMRMEGDMRVLKALRILRTDPCEAEFIQSVIKRIPRLQELRTTCTTRVLSLTNIEKMVELRVLRIRMLEPKAGILSLQPLQNLEQLRELSLRGINNMAQLELLQLQGLKQLETLVLGSCRGMKVASFGQQVLPSLKRLRHLRLENHHSNRSFNINEIMEGLAAGGSVKRVELINVNVDADFSRQLAASKSVQELLLMPNFHNNTAYMMYYIMQAINENSEQLNVFRLGLTYELLSVTRALAINQEKDCIPVALPIPGVPDNDVLNESDEPIAYLPVDRLESILHHMMPQAWLTVAKVSQGETTNLKFLPALPTDAAGISHN